MTNKVPAPLENLDYLTVPEVAKILRASKTFIYKLIREHRLPALKTAGITRIRRADLEKLISSNTTQL